MTHLEILGGGVCIFGEARVTGVEYGLYMVLYYIGIIPLYPVISPLWPRATAL
jgi:hypothetical protein